MQTLHQRLGIPTVFIDYPNEMLERSFPKCTFVFDDDVALGAAGTFWLYAAICVVGFLVVARFLRETKGRALS